VKGLAASRRAKGAAETAETAAPARRILLKETMMM
jgi:hypothetical protein